MENRSVFVFKSILVKLKEAKIFSAKKLKWIMYSLAAIYSSQLVANAGILTLPTALSKDFDVTARRCYDYL